MFKDKDIIITEYSYKLKLLEELSKSSGFLDVKIMTKKEFLENYLFSYDEEAIYYLINKYNISLDLANTYLNSLYYIFDKDYKNDKLNGLVKIKKELIDNNLLNFNKSFKKSLKNKRVVFYKNNYLNKLDKEIIKDLEDVLIIDKKYDKNIPKVYEFSSIFEEVEFVAISILKLIEEGISPSDIKISNIDDEYTNIINFIFGFYNIKTSINNNYLISNTIAKEFLDYPGSLEDKISFIKKYNNDIVNQIVNICNKYVLFDDINIVMNMITNDFKNTTIKKEKYDNEIEIIDYKNYDCENKYVFLMSFN